MRMRFFRLSIIVREFTLKVIITWLSSSWYCSRNLEKNTRPMFNRLTLTITNLTSFDWMIIPRFPDLWRGKIFFPSVKKGKRCRGLKLLDLVQKFSNNRVGVQSRDFLLWFILLIFVMFIYRLVNIKRANCSAHPIVFSGQIRTIISYQIMAIRQLVIVLPPLVRSKDQV